MIKFKRGDLVKLAKEGKYDVILHGVNCHCKMSDGIALQLANSFPAILDADRATVALDRKKLGTYQEVDILYNHHRFKICNLYTQFNYAGFDIEESDLFEYTAFEKILQNLSQEYKNKKIGMPLIGSGHAGGDGDRIIAMIEKYLSKHNVDIIIYNSFYIPKQYYTIKNRINCLIF